MSKCKNGAMNRKLMMKKLKLNLKKKNEMIISTLFKKNCLSFPGYLYLQKMVFLVVLLFSQNKEHQSTENENSYSQPST